MTIGSTFNPPVDQLELIKTMYMKCDQADRNIKAGGDKRTNVHDACQAVYECARKMKVARTTSAEINRLRRIVEHGWIREACNEIEAVYPTLLPYMDGIMPGEIPPEQKRKRKRKKRSVTGNGRKATVQKPRRNMTDGR